MVYKDAMNIRYVTGFGNTEKYKNFLISMPVQVATYWPEGEIYVYYEEVPDAIRILHPHIHCENFRNIPRLIEYLKIISKLPFARGIMADGKYNYRYDVYSWCRKVFYQINAAENFDGVLIWLDGDIVTYEEIDEELIHDWINGYEIAVMDRIGYPLDASMIIWDCSKFKTKDLLYNYRWMFESGAIFTLPEWTDIPALEILIKQMEITRNDIAKYIDSDKKGKAANVFDIVMDGKAKHLKGKLKNEV